MSAGAQQTFSPKFEEARGRSRRAPLRKTSAEQLFDQLPPHSPEAEMSLLGSIILDPTVVSEVVTYCSNGDAFYSEAHGAVFDALVQNFDLHQSGDLVQLTEALRDKNVLDDIGGAEYLVQLAESVPSAANAAHYARIVSEKSRLRNLIDAAGDILYKAYHAGDLGPEGARQVLDEAERAIFDIAEQSQIADAQSLNELLHQVMDRLEAFEGRNITGLATGYMQLDEMTSGLQSGELIIVAARPSMGKTALALNLAEQISAQRQHHDPAFMGGRHDQSKTPIAIFSLEMSKQSVAQRMMCARAGVDSQRVRTNRLTEDDHVRLQTACGELGEMSIYVDDTPGMSVLQVRARARRLVAQHGVRCVIVDYLQLLSSPGAARESRQMEVSAISRGLKALARELNIPIVCLSQLNRGAEQREGHRPRMSDLRESGSIEQDADVIALLHREEYYHQSDPDWALDNPDKVGLAELIIAKQRNGPTGVVDLVWDSKTTRFKNHAGRRFETNYQASPPQVAQAEPQTRRVPFAPGAGTGPVSDHRDGGGPDQDFDGVDIEDIPI